MNQRNAWIDKYLLKPLEVLYGELSDVKRALYHDALKGFADEELRQCFSHLRDHYAFQRFPTIADIQKARKISTEAPALTTGPRDGLRYSWEERDRRRAKALNEFLHRFVKLEIYRQAEGEGWSCQIRRYAMAVAWMQVQMIMPDSRNATGYDANILRIDHHSDHWEEFLEAQRIQAATGDIDVSFPSELIAEWKREGEFYRSRAQADRKALLGPAAGKTLEQAIDGVIAA
jgi:hypothetical protein